MKKLTCILTAAMLLAAMTGCGSSDSTAEESADRTETTAGTTTDAEQATASETETTAASADSSPEPDDNSKADDASSHAENSGSDESSGGSGRIEDSAAGGTESSTGDRKSSGKLLPALLKKMNSTANAVTVHSEYEEDGVGYRLDMIRFGKKLYYDVELTDVYEMEICFDGTNGYMIDDETQTFSDYSATDELIFDEMIVDSDSVTECIASGTETFNGSSCRYEDYLANAEDDTEEYEESDPEETETYRYYFDDSGYLVGCKILEEGIEMIYTVTFSESTDESVFSPPADYTEIDEEEMMNQIYMRMLSAMMDE